MAGRTSEETRALLVSAAMAALGELGVARLVTAVGTRAIAARAGVSGPTLFHQFGSVEAFAAAVVARVYDPGASPTDEINAKVDELARSGSPLRTALGLHDSEFARVRDDAEHRLRVGLWAFGGDEAAAAYGHYVRTSDARVVLGARRLYAGWGREVRPPFDLEAFVAAQAALLSGAVIRHSVDPGAIDAARFARSAAALSAVLLRPARDRLDVDQRLGEINGYGHRARWSPATGPGAEPQRRQVLAAAAATFDRLGPTTATMADVARAAHLSESTLYAMFHHRAGLGVEVLWWRAEGPSTAACRREAHEETPDQELHAGLVGLAEFLLSHRELVAGYLAARVGLAPPPGPDPLDAWTLAVLERAAGAGVLRADVVGADLADSLLLVLAARVVRHPAEDASAAVAHAETVCLRGLLAADRPD